MPCYVCVLSCLTLCEPMHYSLPGSSVHGILQARILESVAISSRRGSSRPRHQTTFLASPALAGEFFTTSATWEAHPLVQTAERRCVIYKFMVIFNLVMTHAYVHYSHDLHCSPAGFLERPWENVSANGSAVNSGHTSGLNPATSHHGKLGYINLE